MTRHARSAGFDDDTRSSAGVCVRLAAVRRTQTHAIRSNPSAYDARRESRSTAGLLCRLSFGDAGCSSFHNGNRNQWRFMQPIFACSTGPVGALEDVTPQHLSQGAALRANSRVHGRSLDDVYLVEEARCTSQIRNGLALP